MRVYPDPIAQLSVNFVAAVCAPIQIDTLGISAIDWPQANDSITWQVFNSNGGGSSRHYWTNNTFLGNTR